MSEAMGAAKAKHGSYVSRQPTGELNADPLVSLLRRIFGGVRFGQLLLELPSGRRMEFAGTEPGHTAHIRVHRWRLLRRVLLRGDIGFAEAYRDGDWSTPDLWSVLTWGYENLGSSGGTKHARWFGRVRNSISHALRSNTRFNSRRNISAHYDLGNEFYGAWLDSGMTYSSALFETDSMTLEEAQAAKMARVCSLLQLNGGERVLEIGCGWGALATRLGKAHGCHVTGITLSCEQRLYTIARLAQNELASATDIRLLDYRDLQGRFDRIVSIEMLEAVGERYWPTYFKALSDHLKPGGSAVIQTITITEDRFQTYRSRPDFIQLHIFPGGMLPTKTIVREEAARAGLSVESTQAFGASYAKTLIQWRERFNGSWKQIEDLGFDERFRRLWNYYLVYCQVGFEHNSVDVCLFRLTKAT